MGFPIPSYQKGRTLFHDRRCPDRACHLSDKGAVEKVAVRKMKVEEYALLEDFLYDVIYLPKGVKPLPKEIIQQPKVAAYVEDFGQPGDCCLVAECEGRLIGAVWTRTQME